ncbi:gag-pol polyprotein [Cucumis melo var. makuwa]|uniref:Gag-pol polyprotein n=1 Tax=Cucumis melo var. makuwa TaxID=1194695 RepID=A0A5D3DZQ7_CUCMM|nr:gag-pol polyprotein [Cucumis melo var. makuwa]TYK29102.1 gag-pol polyprotein [Cucumis melo var. makuwa]
MTEDKTVSEYNERVLKIANDSLLFGEKIYESKIVHKVLRSLPRKFDMKVTAIEEAQDITTLKLDELFESLLMFEMAMSDRESKKGKGIEFKSVYDQENTVNPSGNEANQDESIALLTKQFSKMARKFKSLDTAGKTDKTRRHDGENSIRKVNDFSNRRNNDHGKKMEDVGMSFRCKEWQNGSSKYGLGFDTSTRGVKIILEVKFVPASVKETTDPSCKKLSTNTGAKFSRWETSAETKTFQTHVDAWYFDSGSSRHMTGNRSFFTELEECVSGHVTFGDGAKGKIIAKGNINKSNLPCLNKVRYVDGLKANLISVSQLCDQGYSVNFNNTGYVVTDKNNQVFMSRRREADNYYHWSSNGSNICHLTKVDQTWLWHTKLGHISLRSLDKIIKNEAVVGIPSLDINGKFFCGDCQVGKQTKTSYRRLKECYTIRVLELLHLDLMGPMQIRSLGGKNLCLNLQREKGQKIIRIRSDHGKEFDNEDLNNFCQTEGIHHEFAASITPQQNGVVERKNRTLQEMARNNRAYRVFNIKSETVIDTINAVVNDFESNVNQLNIEDDETHVTPEVTSTPLDEIPKGDLQLDSAKTDSNITDEVINNETVLVPSTHVKKNHPSSSIIGDPSAGITTRRKEKVDYTKMIADLCYVSTMQPTSIENALKDEYWINVMQEELLQFKRNNVWTLVPKPDGGNVVGTNAFRNGYLNEEVYVAQPKGFVDSKFPQYVYKMNKALDGLKQAPRAWYERLTMYLGERGYFRGETDKTLFINRTSTDLIIKQRSEGMFISHEKYAKNLVKKFGLDQSQHKRTSAATHAKIMKDTVVKRIIKYVHGTTNFWILYSYDTSSELVAYCDADEQVLLMIGKSLLGVGVLK